jgi:hypothetical protein
MTDEQLAAALAILREIRADLVATDAYIHEMLASFDGIEPDDMQGIIDRVRDRVADLERECLAAEYEAAVARRRRIERMFDRLEELVRARPRPARPS